MGSVINTWLSFGNPYYGNYVVSGGYRYYHSWNSVVLFGSAATLNDQQHDNDGKNYLSFRVSCVHLKGVYLSSWPLDGYSDDGKLTVVLYKLPVKYKNGYIQYPTVGFANLNRYVLYSDPESIVSWGVFNEKIQVRGTYKTPTFDFSLSCNKPFTLGPTDLLCCNVFFDSGTDHQFSTYLDVFAKVVFDVN